MSHTTCTLLGPFDPPEQGRIAAHFLNGHLVRDGGAQDTAWGLRGYGSRPRR